MRQILPNEVPRLVQRVVADLLLVLLLVARSVRVAVQRVEVVVEAR